MGSGVSNEARSLPSASIVPQETTQCIPGCVHRLRNWPVSLGLELRSTPYFLIVFAVAAALMKHLKVEVLTVKHAYLAHKHGGTGV